MNSAHSLNLTRFRYVVCVFAECVCECASVERYVLCADHCAYYDIAARASRRIRGRKVCFVRTAEKGL